MKVVMYVATSLDGFLARLNDDTSWISDTEHYIAEAKRMGHQIVGSRTFERFKRLLDLPHIYVMTDHPEKFSPRANVEYFSGDPTPLIEKLHAQGVEEVMLGGGGLTNGVFAEKGLIDEAVIGVHPILLGEGKPVLGNFKGGLRFKLLKSLTLETDVLQNYYKVIK